MGFIIPLILTIVVIWIYQGTKGVNYLFSLKRRLIDEYGWTKSEFDIMWKENMEELNNLHVEGQSISDIAKHVDAYLSHYKTSFK
ncbi:uncharacterized protein METZ01_LOCUS317116 [marine metagenome]|uniref:Uncharacterized protein n=1 Tax=marine metagenome TaxID=408172 RepID=A0A382NX12_9ZZZZ